MANDYEYNYRQGRYNRDYYDEPYQRGYDDPYYRNYGRYYAEPYNRGYGASSYYEEPYGGIEYNERFRDPNWRGYESRYRGEPYYRGQYNRSVGRSFFERAGDEIRSWFGDEEAERRRRMDE